MENNEIIQIIFAGIVALSTVFYVILTRKLVLETNALRILQITPDIHIYFEMSDVKATSVYIVIENKGNGLAKNVKFEIIKDFEFYNFEKLKLKNNGIISNGLENFYPKQKFKYYFTNLSENYNEKIKDFMKLKVIFEDINSKKNEKDIDLNFGIFSGYGLLTYPDTYIGRIAFELKEIKDILKKINK